MTAPELVVPGNPADWLPTGRSASCGYLAQADACPLPECTGPVCARPNPPDREWLTVKTLPEVIYELIVYSFGDKFEYRPLRAGDTVTLARDVYPKNEPYPFATATVAEVLPIVKYGEHNTIGRYVVVQVEPGSKRAFLLDNSLDLKPMWPIQSQEIDLPDAIPGGWAIRLTNVKETT